jgi:hypothetical protein
LVFYCTRPPPIKIRLNYIEFYQILPNFIKFNEIARVRFFYYDRILKRCYRGSRKLKNTTGTQRPKSDRALLLLRPRNQNRRRRGATEGRPGALCRAKREIEVSGKEPGRSPVRVEENHEAGGKKDRRQRAKSDRSPSWCARSWR